MSRRRTEYNWTTNRSVYNKRRKLYLEGMYEIYCAHCGYHKCENYDGNHYGGFDKDNLKYPSWKLVTKNRKQWMKKDIQIANISNLNRKPYYTITWKRRIL